MQRNGYRAQYAQGVEGDFGDVFDIELTAAITFTTDTPIFTVAYDRTGTWAFDGWMLVRNSLTEAFTVTFSYSMTDTSGLTQLVLDGPVAANNAAGDVFTGAAGFGASGSTGAFTFSSTANAVRAVKLYGSFQVVTAAPGTIEFRATKSSGAGATSVRLGSRLRGARIPT